MENNIVSLQHHKDLQKIKKYKPEPLDPNMDGEIKSLISTLIKAGNSAQEIAAALGLDAHDPEIISEIQHVIDNIIDMQS